MNVTPDQVRILCEMQGLAVPDDEIENIATRLSTWLTAMEQVEAELGDQLNSLDPIPPVFPKEDFD